MWEPKRQGHKTCAFVADTDRKRRAVALVRALQRAECTDADVFAHDNTNAIEGHFNGLKRRMQASPLTLLDVFRAVDTTEPSSFLRDDLRCQCCQMAEDESTKKQRRRRQSAETTRVAGKP